MSDQTPALKILNEELGRLQSAMKNNSTPSFQTALTTIERLLTINYQNDKEALLAFVTCGAHMLGEPIPIVSPTSVRQLLDLMLRVSNDDIDMLRLCQSAGDAAVQTGKIRHFSMAKKYPAQHLMLASHRAVNGCNYG